MTDDHRGPVLVAIDDSAHSRLAVDWAATEASVRGTTLRLAHSVGPGPEIGYDETGAGLTEQVFEAATGMLEDARGRIAAAHPRLPVDTVLVHGRPAEAVLDAVADADAEVVVLGTRGRGGFAGLLLGSVSMKVAAHANRPVVVARGQAERAVDDDIVVGIRDERDEPAVRFALAEGDRRRATVRLVHAWTPLREAGLMVPQVDRVDEEQHGHAELLNRVARSAEDFPGVRVTTELAVGSPASALVDASREAGLLVLPRHPAEGGLGLPLGTVTHAVLHHASCPVAIVPVR
ncbi:universal stress protein [Streptomyces sp. SID10815]|uniref:universal stress protein n=1 Tax=Streptomyces sp. SID10815 TaxID=2706027 RepID=UPI0013CC4E66|nr:universal stress protein [Streptomyces sp. SID10815]NEA46049.1 universal stress protein [Streptomyces sp. SID10815]